ncbi:hypothetical protein M3J09_006787 [Ascochyta lentis]
MSVRGSPGRTCFSVDHSRAAVSEMARIEHSGNNGAVALMMFRASVLARLMW